MIDRKTFFDAVRRAPANGHLSASQVDGFTRILDEWERRKLTDVRWLAYMLATVWHETGAKMQPISEGGSAAYLRAKPYWPWIGMGLVQVTWEVNGKKFGAKVPNDLLTWPVALNALFDGMSKGMFTGKKLSGYFGVKVDDPTNARRIINGTDKAALIAGYHVHFLTAIKAASASNVVVLRPAVALAPKPVVAPAPVVATATPHLSFWARLEAAFTRKAA